MRYIARDFYEDPDGEILCCSDSWFECALACQERDEDTDCECDCIIEDTITGEIYNEEWYNV